MILVTGASGFVGRVVCAELLARDRLVSTTARHHIPEDLTTDSCPTAR
jgi:uncharacterized protein YbjT (DUF2867 family)